MKLKKLFVVSLSSAIFLFSGCNETVDPLFEKEATERINERNTELRKLLTSSEHGWDISYTPSKGETGNFRFNFKFEENGTVVTNSNYNPLILRDQSTNTSESLYDVSQGLTTKLSFITHGLLHRLSDSDFSPIPGSGGSGLKGDFEFLYYGEDENEENLIFRTNRTKDTLLFKRGTSESLNHLMTSVRAIRNLNSLIEVSFYQKMEYTPSTGDPEVYRYLIDDGRRTVSIEKPVNILGTEGGDERYEYVTGMDFSSERLIIDSLRIGESYIKNVDMVYDMTNVSFTKTLEDGSTIAFKPNDRPLVPLTDHKKVIDPNIIKPRVLYIHDDLDMPSRFIASSFQALVEMAGVGWISLYNTFILAGDRESSDFFFISYLDGTSLTIFYTVDVRDDRIIFINEGYEGDTPSFTNEEIALYNFLFDDEGFYVENLGRATRFTNDIYLFVSVKDPSIRMPFYDFSEDE